MRVLKVIAVVVLASTIALALTLTPAVTSQAGPTEAPAGFDDQTNGFTPQGDVNTPGTFLADKAAFEAREEVADGLGPVYNAQSGAECHQNRVTGGSSQVMELRAGHSGLGGAFVPAPGGSLIQSRAIEDTLQERVPDGRRIVYSAAHVLHVMGFDGGQYGAIGNPPIAGSFPSFSPDGTKIAFHSNRDGNLEIYKVPSVGGPVTRLTNNPAVEVNPAWAPDNSAIAFTSVRSGSERIWTMNTDGSNPSQLSATTGDQADYSRDQGETIRTFRASPHVLGAGFVEATDDSTFMAIRAGQPSTMRGTAINVPLLEAPGQTRLGRFGWKNSVASLLSFSAGAYLLEMGITSPLLPQESTSLGRSVTAFDLVPDVEDGGGPDGFGEDVEAFTRSCARPRRRRATGLSCPTTRPTPARPSSTR